MNAFAAAFDKALAPYAGMLAPLAIFAAVALIFALVERVERK